MRRPWVILSAFLLAGCNTTCQPQKAGFIDGPQNEAFIVAPLPKARSLAGTPKISEAITKTLPKAAKTARAQAPETDPDPTNSTTGGPFQYGSRPYEPKIKPTTDFIIQNPGLFSTAEDQRPWPMTNSPEWEEQQKDDARREKEISKIIQICRC